MPENEKSFRSFEQWQDMIARLYPELGKATDTVKRLSRSVTFQVTDACNLACSYCYQINKGVRRMTFETARKFIDYLLEAGEENTYINPVVSPGIILEFIGGEPFLEIELIDQICDYFKERSSELMHPWATRYCISICSNGVLYFNEKVQSFLEKNKRNLSFSITIDGNKELHDSCRVFPDGRPSYDLAVAGAKDWIARGNYMGSKITIAPGNVKFLFDAIIHMITLGYKEINANCVYEKGWQPEHAAELYLQMKQIADYLLEHDLCREIYCSLFNSAFFKEKEETDLDNWCGGTGLMLSCDPDGWLYPCIRYMESSLGNDQKPMRIGHVDTGIAATCRQKECIHCLNCIDRRTQSTDECFFCPIAEGCSWCSAYNYQEFGTPDHRATYICEMHKARAAANAYYYGKYSAKYKVQNPHKLCIPKEWAVAIIGEEEYEKIKTMYK